MPDRSHFIGDALDLAAAVDDEIKALKPGAKVVTLDGKVHKLGTVTTDTDAATGQLISAGGYSHNANRWVNLKTGTLN